MKSNLIILILTTIKLTFFKENFVLSAEKACNQFIQPIEEVSFNTKSKTNPNINYKYRFEGESRFSKENTKSSIKFTTINDLVFTGTDLNQKQTAFNTKVKDSWGMLSSRSYINTSNFDVQLELNAESLDRNLTLYPTDLQKPPTKHDSNFVIWFVSPYDRLEHYVSENRESFVGYKPRYRGFGVGISYRSHRKQYYYYMIPAAKLDENNGIKENTGLFASYFHNSCQITKKNGVFRVSLRYFHDKVSLFSVSDDSVNQPCINDHHVNLPKPFKILVSSYNGEFETFKYNSNSDLFKLSIINLSKEVVDSVVVKNKLLGDYNTNNDMIVSLEKSLLEIESLKVKYNNSNNKKFETSNNNKAGFLNKFRSTLSDIIVHTENRINFFIEEKQNITEVISSLKNVTESIYEYVEFLNEYYSIMLNINSFIKKVENAVEGINQLLVNKNISTDENKNFKVEMDKHKLLKSLKYSNNTIKWVEDRLHSLFYAYNYSLNDPVNDSKISKKYDLIKRKSIVFKESNLLNNTDVQNIFNIINWRIHIFIELNSTIPFIQDLIPSLFEDANTNTNNNNNNKLDNRNDKDKDSVYSILLNSELKNIYSKEKLFELFEESVKFHPVAFSKLRVNLEHTYLQFINLEGQSEKIYLMVQVACGVLLVIVFYLFFKLIKCMFSRKKVNAVIEENLNKKEE
jgi:hypothetical protein